MPNIVVNVNAGVCGFKTVIKARRDGTKQASIEFRTTCPNLKPLETELTTADAYKECFAKVGEAGIYKVSSKYCRHSACVVPAAILKGIEAACGLALPRDATIEVKPE